MLLNQAYGYCKNTINLFYHYEKSSVNQMKSKGGPDPAHKPYFGGSYPIMLLQRIFK